MKRISLFILTLFLLFTLTSCNDTISKEGGVMMTLPDEWKDAITMNEQAPTMMFTFDGAFNVYETSSVLGYVFTKNDNYKLSDAFSKHLAEIVGDKYIVVECTTQDADKKGALFGDKKLSLDEGTESKEYSIVTWGNDGTRYSYLYRSFIHDGKTYYAYTYNTGITMSMEVPLICQIVDGKQQVYMINLPYDTSYKLNVNTKIKSLLNKDDYLEEEYHTFNYPKHLTSSSDRIQDIKDWYINYCNGREVEGEFIYTYLGIDFVVNFRETDFTIYVK